MDIVQNRRDRLRQWFEGKPLPEKEKSYFSQLINGKASFRERAARRIERDYNMGEGYLDRNDSNIATLPLPVGREQALLALFRTMTDTQQIELLQEAVRRQGNEGTTSKIKKLQGTTASNSA